jgi:hypothetical protein
MKDIIGKITWQNHNVILEKRVFLFCFGEKCMSGRINKLKKSDESDTFEICINFIEPSYFHDELVSGNNFTINEASKILATGEITETG